MSNHVELETTHRVPADFRLPDLVDAAPDSATRVDLRSHHLEALYFDTEDLRLAARGITLRRRTGGNDAGWHLKVPVGEGAKREFHAPLNAEVGHAPQELTRLVTATTRGAQPRPVARLKTERVEHVLHVGKPRKDKASKGKNGSQTAQDPAVIVADDTVTGNVLLGNDAGLVTVSWREIEVELAGASPRQGSVVEKRLTDAGAQRDPGGSKLRRLLGERLPTGGTAPDPTADAVAAVQSYMWNQVETILKHDMRFRLDEEDAVHQMRVATRRLRTVLRAFRSVIDRDATEETANELRWLSGELSPARDLEVLRERFADELARQPDAGENGVLSTAWLNELDARERAALDHAHEVLNGQRYFRLLDALEELRSTPPLHSGAQGAGSEPLSRDLLRAWRRMEKAHRHTETAPTAAERETAWHELRKAAKRARYAGEVSEPVLGKPARNARKAARNVQEVLGRYQDGVAAREFLTDNLTELAASVAEEDRPTTLFTLGVVNGLERQDADAILAEANEVWSKLPSSKRLAKRVA
ncbi:CYTH and CHAD domain-containing protein [Salinactinospora qingdaonensis]|uniref:CYTH and CHAD domain-containing protein n=1 Tax=Salinactinospora qingdaonensis TaxID=702744 RepID=A0ABP7G093_9ACTN